MTRKFPSPLFGRKELEIHRDPDLSCVQTLEGLWVVDFDPKFDIAFSYLDSLEIVEDPYPEEI